MKGYICLFAVLVSGAFFPRMAAYGDNPPVLHDLRWEKFGERMTEAIVDERLEIRCGTVNIPSGARVLVEIWEFNEGQDHDLMDAIEGIVEDDQLRIDWQVVFSMEKAASCAAEMERDGYTVPEYMFTVKYGGAFPGSAGEPPGNPVPVIGSPRIKIYCSIIKTIADENNEPLPFMDYMIWGPAGEDFFGRTDENGWIHHPRVLIGDYRIIIADGGYQGREPAGPPDRGTGAPGGAAP